MRLRKIVPLVAVAALLALAGLAQAEMYVEGYMGGSFPQDTPNAMTGVFPTTQGRIFIQQVGRINPAFMGGGKLGAWFEKSGILSGVNFPAWMKYLGFYLDFSYHNLDYTRGDGAFRIRFPNGLLQYFDVRTKSDGAAATLAFMFAGRYGFFKDSEVPFGRLQPYLAVGPAILFSWQRPTIKFVNVTPKISPGSTSATNIALALETGVRWMALKNLSLDVSFKYRYAQPSYDYSARQAPGILPLNLTFEPIYNLYSFQVGAAYHF